jgi:hypothetical protein
MNEMCLLVEVPCEAATTALRGISIQEEKKPCSIKRKKNETIIGIGRCSESINAVTVNETSARGGKRGKLSSKILFHVTLRGTPRTLKTVDAIYNEAAGGVNNEPRNFGCWSLKNRFITVLLNRSTGEIH